MTSYNINLPNYDRLRIKDDEKEIHISAANKVKYLGITIDNNLKLQHHVDSIMQKIRGLVYKFINANN